MASVTIFWYNYYPSKLETCILRAWDTSKPAIVCPAMNTFMWNHPITNKHLDTIKALEYIIINPISKKLACGDIGIGAMAEVPEILRAINSVLE